MRRLQLSERCIDTILILKNYELSDFKSGSSFCFYSEIFLKSVAVKVVINTAASSKSEAERILVSANIRDGVP